ncbi:MAG: multiheme c-type cytochrome [Byssovorax sp.]
MRARLRLDPALLAIGMLASCAQGERSTSNGAPPAASLLAAPKAPSAPVEKPPFEPPRDDPPAPMPGPRRMRLAAAVTENDACIACHDDEAREWQSSFHHRANTDPAYVAAFRIEPTPFCRSCHAPEADPRKEPPPKVSELGVGCVTCHVTEEGTVLAAEHAGTPPVNAPHPIRRSIELAHQGGCAGCHEFRFPRPGGDDDDAFFMQTTAREHRRSPAAERACADCHMPVERGHRSHAFASVRDPAWLKKNLDVKVERASGDTLRVTLRQTDPGHDFPTGDLFRRLQVGVAIHAEDGTLLHRETRALTRHFELIPGQLGRTLTADDRVTSEPREVDFPLPPSHEIPPRATIACWVTYQRVATTGTGQNPESATIESEIPLFKTTLPFAPR